MSADSLKTIQNYAIGYCDILKATRPNITNSTTGSSTLMMANLLLARYPELNTLGSEQQPPVSGYELAERIAGIALGNGAVPA